LDGGRGPEAARLTPGEGASVLVAEKDAPLIVQAACGLGRVWVVAFDVDAFRSGDDKQDALQKAFWQKALLGELAPRPIAKAGQPGPVNPATGQPADRPELAGELQRSLENFESVQPVSFVWVALFILVYILIVGPLDYFLLKRVFKRLELTWVTFPLVVLVVSVAAYCTAYALKGDELRVNKIDLVEYDLEGPPAYAYGTSWFTLFSPRIQNYTVGLEPSAPGWFRAEDDPDRAARAVAVEVLENPDAAERLSSHSLFRKPYAYAADAAGVERTPVPVWATRSFRARWRAPLDAAKPPVVADLHPDPTSAGALVGSLTNQLPVELQNITVFYHGKWVLLNGGAPLPPGEEYRLVFEKEHKGKDGKTVPDTRLFAGGVVGQEANRWFGDARALGPFGAAPGAAAAQPRPPFMIVKDLLTHAQAEHGSPVASGWDDNRLRTYDHSWRLAPAGVAGPGDPRLRDEAVLIARAPTLNDRAEAVARDPASATRLWLDALPGQRPDRPALSGWLAQETYVVIYVPVKATPK
jgi:hypothetical protein